MASAAVTEATLYDVDMPQHHPHHHQLDQRHADAGEVVDDHFQAEAGTTGQEEDEGTVTSTATSEPPHLSNPWTRLNIKTSPQPLHTHRSPELPLGPEPHTADVHPHSGPGTTIARSFMLSPRRPNGRLIPQSGQSEFGIF